MAIIASAGGLAVAVENWVVANDPQFTGGTVS